MQMQQAGCIAMQPREDWGRLEYTVGSKQEHLARGSEFWVPTCDAVTFGGSRGGVLVDTGTSNATQLSPAATWLHADVQKPPCGSPYPHSRWYTMLWLVTIVSCGECNVVPWWDAGTDVVRRWTHASSLTDRAYSSRGLNTECGYVCGLGDRICHHRVQVCECRA